MAANATEAQPGETPRAYSAFRLYLELGPRRSTAEAGRRIGHASKWQCDKWSSRWNWVERVRAFDAQAAVVSDEQQLAVIAKRSKRQAEIAQLHGDASLVTAREVLRRLADPEKAQEEMRGLTMRELLQAEAAMSRAHSQAVVTERLALGLTTDQPGEAVPRSAAEEAARQLTDEELAERLTGLDEVSDARQRRRSRRAGRS
ncbi:MAG: hypothetical protein WKF96_00250 [Solirubrobacteraceae bacterium]